MTDQEREGYTPGDDPETDKPDSVTTDSEPREAAEGVEGEADGESDQEKPSWDVATQGEPPEDRKDQYDVVDSSQAAAEHDDSDED